jgi:hypothetical protein
MESQTPPHQGVIVDQQNCAGHIASVYRIESLEKDNAHNPVAELFMAHTEQVFVWSPKDYPF